MRLPLVTSHAACKGYAPENTLPGIERALSLGADAIEIDVQCTADGVPVLMHDDSIRRVIDEPAVSELTLTEFKIGRLERLRQSPPEGVVALAGRQPQPPGTDPLGQPPARERVTRSC